MDYQENQAPTTSKNKKTYLVKGLALVLLLAIAFGIGYQSGRKGLVFEPKSFQIINQNNAPGTVDYNLLWDAINTVNQNYIDKPIDQQKVLYGAVAGAVAAVGDPYTTFFSPDDLNNFQTGLQGTFG